MTAYDAVIVGAGFAGAAAASVLRDAGCRALILEARDRVGGRAFTRLFLGEGEMVDFGGSWVAPWHDRIRHYAARCGIGLRPRQPVTEKRWHDGKALRRDCPCGEHERAAFDGAMARIALDANRYARGEARELALLPLSRYLDRIDASGAARAQALAWWTISGNGDPHRISTAELLSSCAYGGGLPESIVTALAHTLDRGASVLVERMIASADAELRLGTPVTHVSQHRDRVTIRLANGEEIEARCVALCLALNVIGQIAVSPALDERKAAAAALGHGGRSIKLWIKASGVAVGSLVTGGSDGTRWMFAERASKDGTSLVCSFALSEDGFDPRDREAVKRCLSRFFPEAQLVSWDWHDWIADPWSRGTWVALPADALWIGDPALWSREGRLAFASSDYAAHAAGWFEGAILAGEQAASSLLSHCLD
jgi:monoamine oxidase